MPPDFKTALIAKLTPPFSNRAFCEGSAEAMATSVYDALVALMADAKLAVVPVEPTIGKLTSMALRYDHAYAAPETQEVGGLPISIGLTPEGRASLLVTMRQLHEEVVGAGFYKPERESDYSELSRRLGLDDEGEVAIVNAPINE